MTEAEWLTCSSSHPMLSWLARRKRRSSGRKMRLFVCACYGRLNQLAANPKFRDGLLTAERFADGEVDEKALKKMARSLRGAVPGLTWVLWAPSNTTPCFGRAETLASYALTDLARHRLMSRQGSQSEARAQSDLLRDVLGSPFRRQGPINPHWLEWNSGTIGHVAQGLYSDRAFDRLPILADALEEAGCTDAAILNHCRGPGPHVRGCWVVDLILGKE